MSHESAAKTLAHFGHADPNDSAARTKLHQQLRGLKHAIMLRKILVDGAPADVTSPYEASAQDEQSDAVYCPYAITITSVKLMPMVAVTAANTDYATISVSYDDGAAGSDTDIATLDTQVASGNWVVGTAKAMTLTSSLPVNVPAGSWVFFSIAKTGMGIAVPPFRIALDGMLT